MSIRDRFDLDLFENLDNDEEIVFDEGEVVREENRIKKIINLSKTHPFLGNFTLTAYVNNNGKQQLTISYIKNGEVAARHSINCIHTVVCQVSAEDVLGDGNSQDFHAKLINYRSTEGMRIELSIMEILHKKKK